MRLYLATFILPVLLTPQVKATPAPKPGESLGIMELSLLVPTSEARSGKFYSEGFRLSAATDRFLPLNYNIDFGFLNITKQRYTQISLFGFGWQPIPKGKIDFFARAEPISVIWSESNGAWFAPGAEVGLLIPAWKKDAIALSCKLSAGPAADANSRSYPLVTVSLGWIQNHIYNPETN